MKVREILKNNKAVFQCEFCGVEYEDRFIDSRKYWHTVVAKMPCVKCEKVTENEVNANQKI